MGVWLPRGALVLSLALAFGAVPGAAAATDDVYAEARRAMVRQIEEIAGIARGGDVPGEIDDRVLAAMEAVPRHELVPEPVRRHAYEDRPLPIGYGQTISQPYIVALMTDLLAVGPDATVLEVGTGSGYQAAVLSGLVDRVYSVEIVEPLAELAARRLTALDYANVAVRAGDGYYGWAEHAPFDAIVVTAAASHVPPPLVEQLRPGARMVIPVGPSFMVQTLMLVEKAADGAVRTRALLPVRFVPLTGGE